MKKLIGAVIIFALLLSGCGNNPSQNDNSTDKKQSKIEIYSAQNNELLRTVENQDTVNKLSDTSEWETLESVSSDLTPEYILLVYQEKTLLHGQDPSDERGYELIETIITYENSSSVTQIISSAVIKNMIIPENALTFYYSIPDSVQKELLTQADS